MARRVHREIQIGKDAGRRVHEQARAEFPGARGAGNGSTVGGANAGGGAAKDHDRITAGGRCGEVHGLLVGRGIRLAIDPLRQPVFKAVKDAPAPAVEPD